MTTKSRCEAYCEAVTLKIRCQRDSDHHGHHHAYYEDTDLSFEWVDDDQEW